MLVRRVQHQGQIRRNEARKCFSVRYCGATTSAAPLLSWIYLYFSFPSLFYSRHLCGPCPSEETFKIGRREKSIPLHPSPSTEEAEKLSGMCPG